MVKESAIEYHAFPHSFSKSIFSDDTPDAFELKPWGNGSIDTKSHLFDQLVCAILLSVKYHVPRIRLESEGDWSDPLWKNACGFYLDVFKDRIVFPEMIDQKGHERAGDNI